MVGEHHRLNKHERHKLWETGKDREAWHTAVHEVTKSWTRLKRLNNNDLTQFSEYYLYHGISYQSKATEGYALVIREAFMEGRGFVL